MHMVFLLQCVYTFAMNRNTAQLAADGSHGQQQMIWKASVQDEIQLWYNGCEE